jgi:ATP-binding cassette subfamily B protein RaxB
MMEPTNSEAVAGGRGSTDVVDDSATLSSMLHFKRARRLPLIRQSEASECGLACLAMIAGYYGHHVTLPQLRQRFSLSLKGVTLARLIEMAQEMGFSSRPIRAEIDEIHLLSTPCIVHWDMDHFVVLAKVERKSITILDPSVGERKISLSEAGRHFTGIALEMTKGPNFQRRRPEPPVSLRALAGSVHGLGKALATIFGLALALEIFALLGPQFLQLVVDQVLADGDHDLLTFLGLSFLLLLLLQIAVSAVRTWTVIWLNANITLSWTGNVFQHLLRLPQAYFLKRHMGDVVSRFGAVDAIQRTLTTQFVGVILDGIMATFTLIVMAFYSPMLTGIAALAIAVYGMLRLLYFRVYRESNLSQIVVSAKQQSQLIEAVRGSQTIKLYGQTARQTARYLNAAADTVNTSIAVQRLNLLFGSLNGVTNGVQRIVILWIGAWLALKSQFSAGMLMAFVAYSDQFAGRAGSLIDYLIQLRLTRLQGERLADIVLSAPESFGEGSYADVMPEASIKFDNVSFRYADGDPWVIRNCSFEIKAGESVVITGPSGAGKSTLVRLMLGLVDPQQGAVLIGGIDIRHFGKNAYRKMIGSVMQDDTLFAGSIADNISFYDEHATPERIQLAARQACLHEEIMGMPMGYQTLVGDMGSSLSGGQQQRVHLARAFYRNPKILIFDEASSHLDASREMRIIDEIEKLNVTRVAIAHRLETVRSAKRVLVFLNGTVAEARMDVATEVAPA